MKLALGALRGVPAGWGSGKRSLQRGEGLFPSKSPHRLPVFTLGALEISIRGHTSIKLMAVSNARIAMGAETKILDTVAHSANTAAGSDTQETVVPVRAPLLLNLLFSGLMVALQPLA